jgi:hypothetical protein
MRFSAELRFEFEVVILRDEIKYEMIDEEVYLFLLSSHICRCVWQLLRRPGRAGGVCVRSGVYGRKMA